jgi:uncharacterized protein with FMN-binding domain
MTDRPWTALRAEETRERARLRLRLRPRFLLSAAPAAVLLAGCGGHEPVSTSSRPATVSQPPAAATTASPKSGSYTGETVQTRFGPVQVAVAVSGRRIRAITFLAVPTDRARSREISSQAEPLLRSEALSAQSASVNLLSGATYTSEGFAQSLQSALSQAG